MRARRTGAGGALTAALGRRQSSGSRRARAQITVGSPVWVQLPATGLERLEAVVRALRTGEVDAELTSSKVRAAVGCVTAP